MISNILEIIHNNKIFFDKIKQDNNLYKLLKYLNKYNNNQSKYYYKNKLY